MIACSGCYLFMIHDYLQKQPRKGILRNFTKFTGKHLCQSLFFNKVAGRNFIKKEALAQVFPCEFSKISKNTFFTEHLRATASVSGISVNLVNQLISHGEKFLRKVLHDLGNSGIVPCSFQNSKLFENLLLRSLEVVQK